MIDLSDFTYLPFCKTFLSWGLHQETNFWNWLEFNIEKV